MAYDKIDKQALLAEVERVSKNWFFGEFQAPIESIFIFAEFIGPHVTFYKIKDEKLKTIELYEQASIIFDIINFTHWLAEGSQYFAELGYEAVMTQRRANNVLATIKSQLLNAEFNTKSHLIVNDLKPIGDWLDKENSWSLVRLPISTKESFGVDVRPSFADVERKCGPFLAGVMSRMKDFDGTHSRMFDMLMCFIGRVLSENTPSRQFVYWYGPGGDGKGTFLMWLISVLESQATTIGHDLFESRFGPGTFGRKRLVCVEEVVRGNFFTERVKELTGNAFISVEQKGKDFEQIRNRMCLIFTSNNKPAFDGSSSQKDRLRYIVSTERDRSQERTAEELEAELNKRKAGILSTACMTYRVYEKKIPANLPEDLEEISSNFFADIDGTILKLFRYEKGAFVPTSVIKDLIGRKSFTQFEQRIQEILEPQVQSISEDEDPVTAGRVVKKRGYVGSRQMQGWHNIAVRNDAAGGFNVNGLWKPGRA